MFESFVFASLEFKVSRFRLYGLQLNLRPESEDFGALLLTRRTSCTLREIVAEPVLCEHEAHIHLPIYPSIYLCIFVYFHIAGSNLP